MRIEACASRCAANAKTTQSFGCLPQLFDPALNGFGPGAHFLPYPDRHCVLKMCATRLDDAVPFHSLLARFCNKVFQRCYQLVKTPQHTQAYRCRDRIVSALCHVHMVIGANGFLLGGSQRKAEDLVGTVGDYFIDIHVMAGASTRLERINNKLVIPFSGDDLIRCLNDGICHFGAQQAKITIHFSRCALN